MNVQIILFSFNRAMQCDHVLRSIRQHLKGPPVQVSVMWHATGKHQQGYARLRQLHEPCGVRFHERSGRPSFLRNVLPRLWRPRNLFHWLKYDYVRKADNFQPLLERLVADCSAEIVCFQTDDNIYFRDEHLPVAALEKVLQEPTQCSYRTYLGQNIPNSHARPSPIPGCLEWDYYAPEARDCWAYPFSVDATFYARLGLLSFLRRMLCHNPVTLESYGVGFASAHGWFRRGLCPLVSSVVAVPLNKVSHICANESASLNIDSLNELFLAGYHLEVQIEPEKIKRRLIIPSEVFAVRGEERLSLKTSGS